MNTQREALLYRRQYWRIYLSTYWRILSFILLWLLVLLPADTLWAAQTQTVSIIGVGDIMLGSDYPSAASLPPNDENILARLSYILRSADITVGNLEGTLFDGKPTHNWESTDSLQNFLPHLGRQRKSCIHQELCYRFHMPSRYGAYLKQAGFDFLSLANNHSNDFGHDGRLATLYNLHRYGIQVGGLRALAEYSLLQQNGLTYGFIAFSPHSGTLNMNQVQYVQRLIREVKSQADIVIVLFHGGGEGSAHQHILRRVEYFHGENRGDVYHFAHQAIDAGADIVFGQGPHVSRAIELYRDRFIAYSAGNFATYGQFNLSGVSGFAPLFRIVLDTTGRFLYGHIIAIRQRAGGLGPERDPEQRAVATIAHLSQTDFPYGNGLHISPDGLITRVE